MRWWIGILLGLLVVGVALMVWRGHPPTAGEGLLAALEKQRGPMRGAIPVLDYTPEISGGGTSGVTEKSSLAPQQWIRDENTDFVWRVAERAKREEQPLRVGIAGDARREMYRALGATGKIVEVANEALDQADDALNKLSDEDLLLAWLAADRAVMGQSDDLVRATREGLLLCARQNPGPAIAFSVGQTHVYLLPMDGTEGEKTALVWAQMEGYENGRLVWTGVLSMSGSPGAEEVRRMAARMAGKVGDGSGKGR